ncbi:MAG: type II toxin-antitoxin system RelE/ParE family toxin [Syntrophomonadaceae bacterium]|nr:type II toxin-antitoxin system RelE/ParE family toxin [Syntrophomonadaceae bacterium]
MNYRIVYTQEAEQDIVDIYRYIAFDLRAPEIARSQTYRIMGSIIRLDKMPLRHQLYQEEPWHSKGLRFLPIDSYLVFYVVQEEDKTVVIIRIMYGKRNIELQLASDDLTNRTN